MSIANFFVFSNIKALVTEFYRSKASFDQVPKSFKHPFRAYICTHNSEFYISDNFHMIRCSFSERCKEDFEAKYPSSIKVYNISMMLICVYEYALREDEATGDAVLDIDSLKVISFDRY